MAITTLSDMVSKMKPSIDMFKISAVNTSAGRFQSNAYTPGYPAEYSVPSSGLSGTSLSAYTNQIPFNNPVSGNTYISRFELTSNIATTAHLYDRLWHNNGIVMTVTTLQTINSVPFPARDINGALSGEGVMIAIEVTTTTGSGVPVITLTYTNSVGVTGRTATMTATGGHPVGLVTFFPLMTGDTGVSAVTGWQASASFVSGAISLIAVRKLITLECPIPQKTFSIDGVMGGFPRCYNNTVPMMIFLSPTTLAQVVSSKLNYSQG